MNKSRLTYSNWIIPGILVFSIFLVSCEQKQVTKDQLIRYIQNPKNGLHQTKQKGDYTIKLMYKPQNLLVAQELKNPMYSITDMNSLQKHYNQYLYFNLSLTYKNNEIINKALTNKNAFSKIIEKLSFDRNIADLITSLKDTLPLYESVFTRMYGMTKSNDILLIFENKLASTEDFKVRINGSDLGFGTVYFDYNTKNIHNIPQLKH